MHESVEQNPRRTRKNVVPQLRHAGRNARGVQKRKKNRFSPGSVAEHDDDEWLRKRRRGGQRRGRSPCSRDGAREVSRRSSEERVGFFLRPINTAQDTGHADERRAARTNGSHKNQGPTRRMSNPQRQQFSLSNKINWPIGTRGDAGVVSGGHGGAGVVSGGHGGARIAGILSAIRT
jgi:hypothetical protein